MTLTALFAATLMQSTPITADQVAWMSGYWLTCDGGREVSETWSDPRGGLMVGNSITLHDGRVGFEWSRIAPTSAGAPGVGYFASLEGGPAVAFPAVEASGTRVVFENPENDFPQRIIYERDGDVLNARIEGGEGDRMQRVEWAYRKAELNARCPA